MTIAADSNTERFEQKLARQQAKRRQIVLGAAWALLLAGLAGVLTGFLGGWPPGDNIIWLLGFSGAGGAALVAGGAILLRERSSSAGAGVDDLINQLAPRILGGRKPEELDSHQRRRRQKRRG